MHLDFGVADHGSYSDNDGDLHAQKCNIIIISDKCSTMPQCSLKSCGGRKSLKIFPRDEVVREKWILFCSRKSYWKPGPGARLCGVHFALGSFASSKRIHLKRGAVPTIKGLTTQSKKYNFKMLNIKIVKEKN